MIERAKAKGTIDRATLLLSAAYLLNSEASNMVEEASEMLRGDGLVIGELKQAQGAFTKAANRYFHTFSELVNDNGRVLDYYTDLEEFDKFFRDWAKLEEKR